MKCNIDIRKTLRESNVFIWQLADKMNVHENTIYRLLRKELPNDKKAEIIKVIKEIYTNQV
ncbi:hypothetical protein [Cytobacillus sp. Bac17]|uniref:hypothetical protein n=1 Tax=Cytobacillus sp. Bac17 TaxID=2926008 RepID=UPI0021176F40|nr:hypothetical protein [Cytobacillus sp. Bac17]